jgi:hypothetical protein
VAAALDMILLLDITREYAIWRFIHDEHGVRPGLDSSVSEWCDENLGRHEVDLIHKISKRFHGDRVGTTETYDVHIRFRSEANLVHFRLRWGGQPISDQPTK